MTQISRRSALALLVAPFALAACGSKRNLVANSPSTVGLQAGETAELRALIRKYAAHHDIPESLLHRVIQRESRYNPGARNGPYYGLMQILPQTARTMGYRGSPAGLLDADTNLHYGGRYLRGAYLVADGNPDKAIQWYARGYYYEAKRKGLLEETGLRS